jgi:hypothetical protein
MKIHWTHILVTALLATTLGCAGAQSGDDSGGSTGQTAKGDCPDCDLAGPGALVQAGVADRFYVPGDAWKVGFQFNQRSDMNMNLVLNVPESDLEFGDRTQSATNRTDVFLFDYRVTGLHQDVFEPNAYTKVKRDVAEIEVTAGHPSTVPAGLVSNQDIGAFEHKVVFEMNDLLDPVSETIYSRRYPNGRKVELDHKSRLKTGSSAFPHTIPRVLVNETGYINGAEIQLSPELEALANATRPGWRNEVYFVFTFNTAEMWVDEEGVIKLDVNFIGEPAGYRDVVYWAIGDLWPFYVRNDQGAGVLVSAPKAQ